MRRIPRRYLVVVLVAVLALVGGAVGSSALSGPAHLSAKDRIAADPPPPLYSAAAIAPAAALIDPQPARARALLRAWWAAHGTARDDAAFVTWVERVFPAPPSDAARRRELVGLTRLQAERTPAGVAAATWLEAHGKKDLWRLAAHDQAELLDPTAATTRKADEKALLRLSKTLADGLGTSFGVSAPYVLRPSLRPDHVVRPGQRCPCSYPSRHAAAAAASRTFLGTLDPERDGEYRWWQQQIDWSRIYMAGHVPSDVAAGTLLGDLAGDYWLVTRAGVAPAQV